MKTDTERGRGVAKGRLAYQHGTHESCDTGDQEAATAQEVRDVEVAIVQADGRAQLGGHRRWCGARS